jgi:hypothetical protein
MVPLHSAGDVGLGTGLPVSSSLDPRLPKAKQGSAVACSPAVSNLLVQLGLPVRCPMGRKAFSKVVTSILKRLRDGSCLLQPTVLLII